MQKKIIISRTDGIGDVLLCLPVAGVLKHIDPEYKVIFLGSSYTKTIIEACNHVDEFLDWNTISQLKENEQISTLSKLKADAILHVFPKQQIARLAKKAGIPERIGTYSRLYHLLTCNRLLNVHRKNSLLHEAQLNLKLLKPFGAKEFYALDEVQQFFGFEKIPELPAELKKLIDKNKFNLVLHPKSKGSAREWGMDNFCRLIEILPAEKFKIFITGTREEGLSIKKELPALTQVTELTGKMDLSTLIAFLSCTDGIVAASTGPLHISAVLGKHAIGLYAPMRPIHPGRWSPVGKNATFMVEDRSCNKCRKDNKCECIESIRPEAVKERLMKIIAP